MKEWDDGHIDSAMREAAGNFIPKYNPAAWTQMQAAMQAEGLIAQSASVWSAVLRYVLPVLILLFILLPGAYLLFDYSSGSISTLAVRGEEEVSNNSPSTAESMKLYEGGADSEVPMDKRSDEVISAASCTEPENDGTIECETQNNPSKHDEKNGDSGVSGVEVVPYKDLGAAKTVSQVDNSNDSSTGNINQISQSMQSLDSHESEAISTLPPSNSEINNLSSASGQGEDVDESIGSNSTQIPKSTQPSGSDGSNATSILTPLGNEMNGLSSVSEQDESEPSSGLQSVSFVQNDSSSLELIVFSPEQVIIPDDAVDRVQDVTEDFKRWSLSAIFSPDFSGATVGKLKGTGVDIGLLVEYALARNFSVSSGVVYSTKKYFIDEGFAGYSERWPGRSAPDEIDASCSVIDIPINFRYYIRNKGKRRIFVSAGISSYFMLTEDYTYLYDTYTVNDWTVSLQNENTHYFGLLNFSFGIQKEIKNGFYIIGEPYYKSPITGIGAGGVSLKSTGFIISIKKEF